MKLTKNFSLSEFQSKDGAKMPNEVKTNIVRLAHNLQTLRNYIGRPITINSGYRSPTHNRSVGGSPNSTHMKGLASDIVVSGMDPMQVFEIIEQLIREGKMNEGGLKAYSTFTHYDIRGQKVRF